MKKSILLLTTLWLSALTHAQSFSTQFSNSTDLNNWSGNTERFIINSSAQLQLNDTAAGMSEIHIPLSLDTSEVITWTLYIKQTLAGSENNQSRIYLASTDSLLNYSNTNLNRSSFYLKLGEAGSNDVIRLFQEVNGVSVELLAGTTLIANSVNIFVQVTRYPDGTWELRSTPNSTGPWTFENAALSNTWFPFQFFGICCKYTSSNATKFYFDNIQIGTPIAEPTYPEPNNHSVVFNEIYADPTPSFGLPLAEYIELYNTTPDTLSLNNCKLVNTTNEKTLFNALLLPYNFLILCDENDVGLFENAIGIPSFTALSNSGDSLTLLNSANEIIDWVSYTIDWHTTDTALVGGISLERINPYFPCGNSSNWASSIHALGGTPNAPNSVLQTEIDVLPPQVQSVVWTDQQIQITWNEFIESSNAQGTFDGNELPLVIEGSNLFFVIPNWNISDTLINILLENISDCWGNTTDTLLTLLHYPSPQFGEVVINEILADPTPVLHGPSAEFIELLNTSNHILSLHSCSLNEKELETDVVIMPREKLILGCLLYTSPSPRDTERSRMPSSA